MNANFAKESFIKANRSSIRQDRTTARRGYHFKKSARTYEELFETAIAESTTWWQQEDYQVQEVEAPSHPHLPAIEWELPKSRTMDVTHGSRAVSLNRSLLIERWSSSKLRDIAQLICETANELLCMDENGGIPQVQVTRKPNKKCPKQSELHNYHTKEGS